MILPLLLAAVAAAATPAPRVGIVADPCADLPIDAPQRPYMEWLVSTDPAAKLPPRSPAAAAASDAARDAHLRYDWANICRYRSENAKLASDPDRVVFVGNSITEYWKVADPAFFSGHNVNRGISGQTSAQTLTRFYADVVALKPAVVHIWVGTNDIAGNSGPTTLGDVENNIRAMVAIAKANDIAVVLASVSPAHDFNWRPGLNPARHIAALNSWLKEYAATNGITFADYSALLDDGRGGIQVRYSRDGVHPNRAAYAALLPAANRAIAAARTAAPDAMMRDFADLFYRQRDVRTAFQRHVALDYIQHNPGIADGRAAAVQALTPLFSTPGMTFEVQRILVDGNFAAIHLRARNSPTDRGTAVVDLYRLDHGKIVEHWDVLQGVPAESKNPHPMF